MASIAAQRSEMLFGDIPDQSRFDALIFVPQDIADGRDRRPLDLRRALLQFIRQRPTGFRDDLEAALDRAL
jgi:hypothetical protein